MAKFEKRTTEQQKALYDAYKKLVEDKGGPIWTVPTYPKWDLQSTVITASNTTYQTQMVTDGLKYMAASYLPGSPDSWQERNNQTQAEAIRWVEDRAAEMADLLDAAHDLLLTEGWVQHKMHGDKGHCALGSIERAAQNAGLRKYQEGTFMQEAGVVLSYLGFWLSRTFLHNDSIPTWNDKNGRTIDDVLDMFRHGAKKLREIAGAQ